MEGRGDVGDVVCYLVIGEIGKATHGVGGYGSEGLGLVEVASKVDCDQAVKEASEGDAEMMAGFDDVCQLGGWDSDYRHL